MISLCIKFPLSHCIMNVVSEHAPPIRFLFHSEKILFALALIVHIDQPASVVELLQL